MSALSVNARAADTVERVQLVAIADIVVGTRLRGLSNDWVATLAESIAAQGMHSPIQVVRAGDKFRLVFGAHRLAAAASLGWSTITATVEDASSLAADVGATLREISENLVRRELSALDRAVHIAAWREIYGILHPVKRGRKPANVSELAGDELSALYCTHFSEAAQRALGISRRTIFYALKIAGLPDAIRSTLATLEIAHNQSELLALADQPAGMLAQIVELLLGGATSVADAVATIEQRPLPSKLTPPERISEGFSRLKPDQQFAFFDLHVEAIDLWRAQRGMRK